MEDNNYNINELLSSAGLAIHGAASALVKYANSFQFKANGRISGVITTADAPSLALATLTAPYVNGVAQVAGALASGFQRTYTLVATLPITGTGTNTPTFSWLASGDTSNTTDQPNTAGFITPNQSNQCVVGYVVVQNATGAAFVPGTTALDTGSLTLTYINNFGIEGN
jgi:hypothetical protein